MTILKRRVQYILWHAKFESVNVVQSMCCQVFKEQTRQNTNIFVREPDNSSLTNVLYQACVLGPFFFSELTVTSSKYFDMFKLLALLQINADNVIFEKRGDPTHYANLGTLLLRLSTALD